MTETQEATTTKKEAFKPVTFWLANPHNMLRMYDKRGFEVVRFVNGKFTAKTPELVEMCRNHRKCFEEDMPRTPRPHPGSGYAPRSQDAYELHQELFPSNL